MGRNPERDVREERRRRAQLLEAGFQLFSARGIENVSLQEVADEAHVGIATLYNYYKNKVNLAIAISTRVWGEVLTESKEQNKAFYDAEHSGREIIAFYCDSIIRLYKEKPELLRFSGDYKTYIKRQEILPEQTEGFVRSLGAVEATFMSKFESAKQDHSLRTDIPPKEMFTTVTITMLAAAERFSQGIVWADHTSGDYTPELEHVKEMLLLWCKAGVNE